MLESIKRLPHYEQIILFLKYTPLCFDIFLGRWPSSCEERKQCLMCALMKLLSQFLWLLLSGNPLVTVRVKSVFHSTSVVTSNKP